MLDMSYSHPRGPSQPHVQKSYYTPLVMSSNHRHSRSPSVPSTYQENSSGNSQAGAHLYGLDQPSLVAQRQQAGIMALNDSVDTDMDQMITDVNLQAAAAAAAEAFQLLQHGDSLVNDPSTRSVTAAGASHIRSPDESAQEHVMNGSIPLSHSSHESHHHPSHHVFSPLPSPLNQSAGPYQYPLDDHSIHSSGYHPDSDSDQMAPDFTMDDDTHYMQGVQDGSVRAVTSRDGPINVQSVTAGEGSTPRPLEGSTTFSMCQSTPFMGSAAPAPLSTPGFVAYVSSRSPTPHFGASSTPTPHLLESRTPTPNFGESSPTPTPHLRDSRTPTPNFGESRMPTPNFGESRMPAPNHHYQGPSSNPAPSGNNDPASRRDIIEVVDSIRDLSSHVRDSTDVTRTLLD
ncbi:hypothetical protein HGRIS_014681 [Hohenbuehelia grisea]|uniref:Uncharacterized protein n=1 Tax=Hohenbuehelia grisea TaxID=104357 RepID=A0ABR3JV72_9AGAR